jgi:rhodanese-related sulfurtransferase
MKISRRIILSLSVAALSSALMVPNVFAASNIMSAPDALSAVEKGEIILVDIRTRGEWKQTGLAAPALPISMHEAGFIRKLTAALGGDRNRPVAIICAVGGRTAHMSGILKTAGFGNVLDVSEGMMGSSVGPGWLKRGLPVKHWKPE